MSEGFFGYQTREQAVEQWGKLLIEAEKDPSNIKKKSIRKSIGNPFKDLGLYKDSAHSAEGKLSLELPKSIQGNKVLEDLYRGYAKWTNY